MRSGILYPSNPSTSLVIFLCRFSFSQHICSQLFLHFCYTYCWEKNSSNKWIGQENIIGTCVSRAESAASPWVRMVLSVRLRSPQLCSQRLLYTHNFINYVCKKVDEVRYFYAAPFLCLYLHRNLDFEFNAITVCRMENNVELVHSWRKGQYATRLNETKVG